MNRDLDKIVEIVRFDLQSTALNTSSLAMNNMSIEVIQMILLIEDRRFYSHLGFEFRAIPRLIKRAIKFQKLGGISTIDQQLVRIITNRRERKFSRKVRETVLATAINSWLSKDELLLSYLKRSYFGRGLIGIEMASQHLFHKDPDRLSTDESAFIASLLARPIPGVVVDRLNNLDLSTSRRPEDYIKQGGVCAPTWAKAILARYEYTLKLFCDSK